jgi:hypothetical protein
MLKKMMSYAASLASRGLSNAKAEPDVKKLRMISCFGGIEGIPPCPYLQTSRINGSRKYCGKCGCGDKMGTWLLGEGDEYGKLDYPHLTCPVNMPGFSNYDPNFVNDEIRSRKQAIEDLDPDNIALVDLTIKSTQ